MEVMKIQMTTPCVKVAGTANIAEQGESKVEKSELKQKNTEMSMELEKLCEKTKKLKSKSGQSGDFFKNIKYYCCNKKRSLVL